MKNTFTLMHLYNKRILSHGAFRVYRLLLDIQNQYTSPAYIKASRRLLSLYTGLSENALKSALNELIALKIIVLKGERPSLWLINEPSNFDLEALNKLVSSALTTASSEAEPSE